MLFIQGKDKTLGIVLSERERDALAEFIDTCCVWSSWAKNDGAAIVSTYGFTTQSVRYFFDTLVLHNDGSTYTHPDVSIKVNEDDWTEVVLVSK